MDKTNETKVDATASETKTDTGVKSESFWARLYSETVKPEKILATCTHIAVLFVISISGYWLYSNYIADPKANVFKK